MVAGSADLDQNSVAVARVTKYMGTNTCLQLYLTKPDYDERCLERIIWEDRERVNSEEAYRKIYQSNSGALVSGPLQSLLHNWLCCRILILLA